MEHRLQIPTRPTHALISKSALAHNVSQVKKLSPNAQMCVAVKAEAYGHGLVEVTKILESLGVYWFAVSILEEAIKLRKAGVVADILVLGGLDKQQAQWYAKHNIVATAPSIEKLHILNSTAQTEQKNIRVHIKVDTGMGRLGVQWNRIERFARQLSSFKNITIEGLYTHFAQADENTDFSKIQLNRFEHAQSVLRQYGVNPPIIHTSNSAGIIKKLDASNNMVRPGLMVYGISPIPEFQKNLKPVLSLVSKIAFVKTLLKGDVIGYGSTYTVQEEYERIATIPIGYGDGISRMLSNNGHVLIRGKKYPIVGRVCMDQLMVSLGKDGVGYNGDEVVFIGSQQNQTITAEDIAQQTQTIPYEVLTSISGRVPRVYID